MAKLPMKERLKEFLYDVLTNVVSWIIFFILVSVGTIIWFQHEAIHEFLLSEMPIWPFILSLAIILLLSLIFIRIWRREQKNLKLAMVQKEARPFVTSPRDRYGFIKVNWRDLIWRIRLLLGNGKLTVSRVYDNPFCPHCDAELTDYAPFEWGGIPALFGHHNWGCPNGDFRLGQQVDPKLIHKELRDIVTNWIEQRRITSSSSQIIWD